MTKEQKIPTYHEMYRAVVSWFTRPQPNQPDTTVEELLGNRYPAKLPWDRPVTSLDYVTIWLYQAINPIARHVTIDDYWGRYRSANQRRGLAPVSYDVFRDEYLEAHYTVLFVIRRREALWTTTIDNDEDTIVSRDRGEQDAVVSRERGERPSRLTQPITWEHLIAWYHHWVKKWRLVDSTKSWGLFLRQVTIVVGERLTTGWEDLTVVDESMPE